MNMHVRCTTSVYLTYVHGNTEYIITVFATEDQSFLKTGPEKFLIRVGSCAYIMLLRVLLCTFLGSCVGVQAQDKDGYQPTSSTSESVKSTY